MMLSLHDAALLIGDGALEEMHAARAVGGAPVHVFDLAREWRALTSHPFTFAVWAARRDAADALREADFAGCLAASLANGMTHLDTIAARAAARLDLPVDLCTSYLRNFDYGFGAELQAGLVHFVERASGVAPRIEFLEA